MAWTSPKTWSVAETVTAANVNTHLRDNLNWLANDHPRVSARRTSVASTAHLTPAYMAFDASDEFDTGAMHDPASNNTRLTVPSGGGGLYIVNATVTWAANATGGRDIRLHKNGSQVTGMIDTRAAKPAGDTVNRLTEHLALVATDYLQLEVLQDSGGNLNITDARFQACWVAF